MNKQGLVCIRTNTEVPLENIQVTVHIHDFIACVVSTLKYVNQDDRAIEAEFLFPMDDDSAVYKFEVEIDGRVIVGECQEKQQAKDTYNQAMQSGYGAFLLQESDASGDIFQMNVGNLPAGKTAVVTFSYVLKLKVDFDGLVSYKLPTVLHPRYSPNAGVIQRVFRSLTPSYFSGPEAPYSLDFTAVIKGSKTFTSVKCPTVASVWEKQSDGSIQQVGPGGSMTKQYGDESSKVKLSEKFRFDCDIEILVQYDNIHQSTTLVGLGDQEQSGLLKQDVAMLNIFPSVNADISTNKMEFVFVVDRSGSMGNEKIGHAKDTLLLFLKSLPVGCCFNIISFGSSFSVLFPNGSKMYNQDSLDEALALHGSMKADMGGTEILEPLRYMYTKMKVREGYGRQVFVLTDGEVSNTREVINLISKNSDNSRVFTFGIGHGASTSLVKGMANAGKGRAEMVTGKDRLQAKVMSSLKKSMQGGITDMKLTWELTDGLSVINMPEKCPTIYAAEHFVSFAIFKGQSQNATAKVTLSATIGESQLAETVQVDLNNGHHDENFAIHRLAAKEQIKALESEQKDDMIELSNSDSDRKEKILLLSLSTNIVSQCTAFVGVDRETREITCHKRSVPSPSISQCAQQNAIVYAGPPPLQNWQNYGSEQSMPTIISSAPVQKFQSQGYMPPLKRRHMPMTMPASFAPTAACASPGYLQEQQQPMMPMTMPASFAPAPACASPRYAQQQQQPMMPSPASFQASATERHFPQQQQQTMSLDGITDIIRVNVNKVLERNEKLSALDESLDCSLDGITDIMRVNVDKVLERNEKLSALDEKADCLSSSSTQFYSSANRSSRGFQFPSLGIGEKLHSAASTVGGLWKTPTNDMNRYCNDNVMYIISLQNFDGSWNFTDSLKSVLATDGKEFKTRTNISDEKIIATIHAISWLEKNHKGRKDEWSMIVDKAIDWLKTQQLQGVSIDDLKAIANGLLK